MKIFSLKDLKLIKIKMTVMIIATVLTLTECLLHARHFTTYIHHLIHDKVIRHYHPNFTKEETE
jgi:Na+-translocating ferredoxin:NAD+ oxidoreductase RnfE subunit